MCGIIGYTGNKNAKDIIISGLKTLEYRGYDSAGIAVNENGIIHTYKSSGKIKNLEELLKKKSINSNTSIGHTRWATHGKPNETNAHPHRCGITNLVHNGIIENYIELKNFLINKGVIFNSSTDTEVACAYINYIYENNKNLTKIEIIKKACDNFIGSYAFGIIFDDEPDYIYTAKLNSPLLIGLGDKENFIASDISAFLSYTKKYVILQDNFYAKLKKESVEIYDNNLKQLQNMDIKEANFEISNYQKNGFEHFMLKEIHEQPKAVTNVFRRYFEGMESKYDEIDFTKFKDIHIVACGSAMHAGFIGKYLFETYANIATYIEVASEYRYKKHVCDDKTLVIAISQSGETADTIAALNIAKQNGCTTVGIVNAVGSTISQIVDTNIYTHAGPEIAVATTKGYTTQVATLACLVLSAMKQKNISKVLFNELEQSYTNIEKIIKNVISNNEYINIANNIKNSENLFYIGRGIDYSISMEGSLKLKEISYIHSESYAAGELKHGTISLIENGTPIIAIATDPNLFEKTISNIKETKSRGAFIILITTDEFKNKISEDFCDISLILPKSNNFFKALIVSTALQLIAYETAKLKNCDIDKPKNLAKSVTVE